MTRVFIKIKLSPNQHWKTWNAAVQLQYHKVRSRAEKEVGQGESSGKIDRLSSATLHMPKATPPGDDWLCLSVRIGRKTLEWGFCCRRLVSWALWKDGQVTKKPMMTRNGRSLHALKKALPLLQHLRSVRRFMLFKSREVKDMKKELYQKVANKNKRDTSTSKQEHNTAITMTTLRLNLHVEFISARHGTKHIISMNSYNYHNNHRYYPHFIEKENEV